MQTPDSSPKLWLQTLKQTLSVLIVGFGVISKLLREPPCGRVLAFVLEFEIQPVSNSQTWKALAVHVLCPASPWCWQFEAEAEFSLQVLPEQGAFWRFWILAPTLSMHLYWVTISWVLWMRLQKSDVLGLWVRDNSGLNASCTTTGILS